MFKKIFTTILAITISGPLLFCSGQMANKQDPSVLLRNIVWGDNESWAKIDSTIYSYYFTGYITGSSYGEKDRDNKYEAAYIRPKTYFIKQYARLGNEYIPVLLSYADKDKAWLYYYSGNVIIDRSSARFSFEFAPELTLLTPSEQIQIFDCMETRFPMPPKSATMKKEKGRDGKDYDIYFFKMDDKWGSMRYAAESHYLIDPVNKWPVSITLKYKENGRLPIISDQWLPIKKHNFESIIYYENIQYNLSPAFIENTFQIPKDARHSSNQEQVFGKVKVFDSNSLSNRFERCDQSNDKGVSDKGVRAKQ